MQHILAKNITFLWIIGITLVMHKAFGLLANEFVPNILCTKVFAGYLRCSPAIPGEMDIKLYLYVGGSILSVLALLVFINGKTPFIPLIMGGLFLFCTALGVDYIHHLTALPLHAAINVGVHVVLYGFVARYLFYLYRHDFSHVKAIIILLGGLATTLFVFLAGVIIVYLLHPYAGGALQLFLLISVAAFPAWVLQHLIIYKFLQL